MDISGVFTQDRAMRATRGQAVSRPVPVLMYHSVATRSTPTFRQFVTDPARFADHMAALVDGGYEPLSVSSYAAGAAATTCRPVVLTFDDAFLDFHEVVLPILTDLRLTATLFVPTAYVGGTSRWLGPEGEADRPMMAWSAITEAASAGVEIGSHSRTHPPLDLLTKGQMIAEVRDSRSELEDRLQQPVLSFAYPFGYYDGAVKAAVDRAGYRSACAVRDLASSAAGDPLAITRWTVRHGLAGADLIRLLEVRSGLLDTLRSDARARGSRALRRLGHQRSTRSLQGDGRTATPGRGG